ncbi:AAA family ATPase [Microbacterium sp.]|uniref:AAA family ATPase n=1 Tax=Microbacterium sp. TaxID=51671 RepID=UPI0025F34526|nr:AAA family ATPase [Microbacterium sp.]
MLGARDPLPIRPRRILVAGVSGVGKTTLARRLSGILDIPHTEIDALFHGPDWTPRASFADDVRALIARDAWITEWQYSDARPLLAERADLLVWLDLPYLRVTLPQVVRRTVRRRWRREELWNGNLEGPLWAFFTDSEHIVRWSWSTRRTYAPRVAALRVEHPSLTIVRLRTPGDVEVWLGAVAAGERRRHDDPSPPTISRKDSHTTGMSGS